MNLHVIPPTIIEPPVNISDPKPTDFDNFLPWACKQLCVTIDVVVTRATQKTYVTATVKNRKYYHRSKKILQSSVSSPILGDDKSSVLEHLSTEDRIMIETVYDIYENLVQLKFLKNKDIPRTVMQTIALTIPFQPHLTSITINSGLCMDSLYELSKILPNSYITELCLDRTFLSQANYHILLTDSKIKYLSLSQCTINDAVVKTIADQLKYSCPASKVLSALNLSSNRITDVGAKYLADVLRTNRQLSYLNLAGNMITDEGGMKILGTLHEFPLQPQEIIDSRARYVAYLKKKNDLINTLIIELQAETFNKIPNKKKALKKSKLGSQSLLNLNAQKYQFVDSGVDGQTTQERANNLAEGMLGLFNEPFSPNYTKTKDGVVHCFGNNTLCYLNIAYNNLTYASVKKLFEVLSTQKSLNRTPRGLIKVVIEGNLMPVACKEYREINQLLQLGSGLDDIKKHTEFVTRKKTFSSRPTAK